MENWIESFKLMRNWEFYLISPLFHCYNYLSRGLFKTSEIFAAWALNIYKMISPEEEIIEVGPEVVAANLLDDPLDLTEDCRIFQCKTGEQVILRHYKSNQLSKFLIGWALKLMQTNMSSLYNTCSWGWNRQKKKNEMLEENARYLIGFMKDKPVGFTHFRFDMDYDRQVIYCYEIQMDEKFRSLHLGTHLMKTLEVLAVKTGMSTIVLTVLKHNPAATRFFGQLGYEHDESNFDDSDKLEYEILSKKVQPL